MNNGAVFKMLINAFYNLPNCSFIPEAHGNSGSIGCKAKDIKTCLRVQFRLGAALWSAKGGKKFFVILRVVFLGRFAEEIGKNIFEIMFFPRPENRSSPT